ncbi:MAG TPA: family 43 glycosylhydrolase [Candidatus Paenibacillus intestinavium]|nr:family 43 glycosylhydrolase [Candidatus Paenibacillus intestinavium]
MKITRKQGITAVVVLLVVLIAGGWLMFRSPINDVQMNVPYNGHGGTYKNLLVNMDTPDPSVAYHKGFYYMTFTHDGVDIMLLRSKTLDFRGAEQKVVWYPPVNTMYSANLWAPEIQFIQGKWYIYFAADNGQNENHRMYALEAVTDDPMGEYSFKGQVTDATDKWAIDGLVLEQEDQLYFVWSGWEGDENIAQNTYIAPMSNPYTINGPRVLISKPDLAWEQAGGPPYINEGQAILKKDGQVHIAYSGAGSWTPDYSIGLLTLEKDADPLDAAKWSKKAEPLMTRNDEASVYGPGHNSFVASPDGSETFIVYHATTGINDGWGNRRARAQRVEWNEQGQPKFGVPLSLMTAIAVPEGSGIYRSADAIEEADGYRYTGISTMVDTMLPILFHYQNVTGENRILTVALNGQSEQQLKLAPTGDNEVGYVYLQSSLLAGEKAISLQGEGVKEYISAIEIPRYEAEYATVFGDSEAQDNPFASNSSTVFIAAGKQKTISFTNIKVPAAGEYELRLAIANTSGQEQTIDITINEVKKQSLTLASTERNQFVPTSMIVKLGAGSNVIHLGNATSQLEIDYIDICATVK